MLIKKIKNWDNLQAIVDIYNSNKHFLIHHLGREFVDKIFIHKEISKMKEIGFCPNLVIDNGRPIGVIDYKIQPSGYVYLSLLMLDYSLLNKGLGTRLYRLFEKKMIKLGASVIRIDVVNDYRSNAIPFWESLGFVGFKESTLTWGYKTSSVLIMKKHLI